MAKFFLILSLLTATRALTLLDKNNQELFPSPQLEQSPERIQAEKTNEIRKSSNTKNSRRDDIHSEVADYTSVRYSQPHKVVKKQKNKQWKERKPKPISLLKSAEDCRRTKMCETVPLAQVIKENPELAKRLRKWIKIYGPPAEDVVVLQ